MPANPTKYGVQTGSILNSLVYTGTDTVAARWLMQLTSHLPQSTRGASATTEALFRSKEQYLAKRSELLYRLFVSSVVY